MEIKLLPIDKHHKPDDRKLQETTRLTRKAFGVVGGSIHVAGQALNHQQKHSLTLAYDKPRKANLVLHPTVA